MARKSSSSPAHVFTPAGGGVVDAAGLFARAVALHRAGRLAEAEQGYREVLARAPGHPDALHRLGVLALQVGHPGPAAELIGRAVAATPGRVDVLADLGLALHAAGRHEEALARLDEALALDPGAVVAQGNRGLVLHALHRDAEAQAVLAQAVSSRPQDAELHFAHANVLLDLRRLDEAVAAYSRALALDPSHGEARMHRGNALRQLQRHDEALADYDAALARAPGRAGLASNRGDVLMELKRYAEAARVYGDVLAADAAYPFALGKRLHAQAMACDWQEWDMRVAAVDDGVRRGARVIEPFAYAALATRPQDLQQCARIFAHDQFPPRPARVPPGRRHAGHARIRLGYLGGEFRNQATSLLAVELWELHDRGRFELFAFDNGHDDGSALRRRVLAAFDDVVDISRLSDDAAADAVAAREIDILVNLNGWFGLGRTGVFAHHPAPLQVNFLGFPGTLGAPYLDVLVADEAVIPPGEDAAYDERVVRLPRCYQPNDRQRPIATQAPTRAEAGLPPAAFVYACFNNTYKILPAVFATWMRILAQVDGAVLWLLDDNPDATRHLRQAAGAAAVDPGRLHFAPRLPLQAHLARHALADLFLDTTPYNAHTTASDALWAGLPVLTCRGSTFPGRVGQSLLQAVGLADALVAADISDYESRAIALGREPSAAARLRARLESARASAPLWDTPGYVRDLEAALLDMR